MAKFHLNDQGEATRCTARLRPCPLGGEHFDTKEAAQKAYEKGMAAWAVHVPEKPERVLTEKQVKWAEDFSQLFDSMFNEKDLQAWDDETSNSFESRIARASKDRGKMGKYEWASLVAQIASSERASLSSQARTWAKSIVEIRTREAQAQQYDDLLKDVKLEQGWTAADFRNPFKVEAGTDYPVDTYLASLQRNKERLDWIAPLADLDRERYTKDSEYRD